MVGELSSRFTRFVGAIKWPQLSTSSSMAAGREMDTEVWGVRYGQR